MRDGVSLNESTRTKPLVMPEEIGALENLVSYIKLPGSWPITKKKMIYKKDPQNPAQRFVQDPLLFLQEDDIVIAPKKKEKVEKNEEEEPQLKIKFERNKMTSDQQKKKEPPKDLFLTF